MKNYSILYFLTVILFACNGKSGSQSKSTEPSDSAQIIKIQNTIDTTVNGVTFNVSSVKPADSLLKTYPVKDMMELKIEKKIKKLAKDNDRSYRAQIENILKKYVAEYERKNGEISIEESPESE